jgi:predicted LPLAT superfamily acyltransferase
MTNASDPYVACSSLEWKLGIHLGEWRASRNLAKRMGEKPSTDDAYLQGVKDLLNDYLSSFQPMQLSNLLDVSKRQDPVIDHLANLLDDAKATAAAISDNAIEEQRPIPSDLLRSFNNDLERIKAHLLTAADVPEKIHTAS